MLVLTRKKDQSIVINGDVIVSVLDVSPGGTVKLGVMAPPEVDVDRMEVHERKEAEKRG